MEKPNALNSELVLWGPKRPCELSPQTLFASEPSLPHARAELQAPATFPVPTRSMAAI